uniref:Uncharacterized protein n=1 Tax=Rhizophora mucronata TaxID=61149 RepID=A0A2P2QHJ1_RHIMU
MWMFPFQRCLQILIIVLVILIGRENKMVALRVTSCYVNILVLFTSFCIYRLF